MLQLVLVAHFQPGDQRAPRFHAFGVCVSLPARKIAECEWVERAAQVRLRPAVVQCSTYRQTQWGWLLVRLFREGFIFRSTGPGQGQGNRARDIGSMAGRGPPERTVDAPPSDAFFCVVCVAGGGACTCGVWCCRDTVCEGGAAAAVGGRGLRELCCVGACGALIRRSSLQDAGFNTRRKRSNVHCCCAT